MISSDISLKPDLNSLKPSDKYVNWRRCGGAEFHFNPPKVETDNVQVRDRCIEEYRVSNEVFDQAIADAALRYVYEDGNPKTFCPGPLLKFAQAFSRRYLDLYEAISAYEKSKGISMIPMEAGQLKNFGFTSSEILRMQKGCKSLIELLQSSQATLDATTLKEIIQNSALDEQGLLNRACCSMLSLGYSVQTILPQLRAIADMIPIKNANEDERLLMEIRHRVASDGTFIRSPGWNGSNPLAYLNLISMNRPDDLEAVFRGMLFFVYMNKAFTNLFFQDKELMEFTNQFLAESGKNWQIDPEFIDAMNALEPKSLPPVFNVGEYAALNSHIREPRYDPDFYQKYPKPLLNDVVKGKCDLNAPFRRPLSERELLLQTGDFGIDSIRPGQTIDMVSGGSLYRLKSHEEIDDRSAKEYRTMTQELQLPNLASISGTFDHMAMMAGFTGVALEQADLLTFRLAMIAFMVPCRDHSVHEILQSSKSFGLPYTPGPGFEKEICPALGESFVEQIIESQENRGYAPPSYYLSAHFASQIYRQIVAHEGSLKNNNSVKEYT